ncbi:MAG: hypothetical protein ABIQ95_11810 [Bdellovibrionia bacterium]
MRYIDDFVVCFQYRSDAIRFQNVLRKRLAKFSLSLEPNKTRLVEFGRFAARHAKRRNTKLETIYFLGFTHFCNRNRSGAGNLQAAFCGEGSHRLGGSFYPATGPSSLSLLPDSWN